MLSNKLLTAWNNQDPTNKSLAKAMFTAFLSTNGPIGLYLFCMTIAKIAQATFLGYLIKFFEEGSDGTLIRNDYFLSFIVVVLGIIVTLLHHHFYFLGWRFGMNLRVAASV